jgi:hypothetical protein
MAWPADSWDTRLTCITQTPADAISVAASYQTLSVHWHDTNAADILAAYGAGVVAGMTSVFIYYRINGAAWSDRRSTYAPPATAATLTQSLTGLSPGDRVEWYSMAVGQIGDPATFSYVTVTATRSFTIAADSTGPTISTASPADDGTDSPDTTFSATVTDAYGVESVALWIDGAKVDEETAIHTTSYAYSYNQQVLSVGAHDWYLVATDVNGNVTTLPTRTLNSANTAPDAPSTPVWSGAMNVGEGGLVYVTWAASFDHNGDALTYDFEVKYGAADWVVVATGIGTPGYVWTPTTAGSATYVRVRAHDGTAYSSYATTISFIVVPNTAPNEPTIVEPSGAESLTEGETFSITWTEHAAPHDAEGNPITYEGEFSKAGTFADTVSIFSGVAEGQTSTVWTLATTLVAADTATCKVRIRARDSYNGVSAWSTSAAFTVNENAAPVVAWVGIGDGDTLVGSSPVLTLLLTDADSDACHVEIELSETADYAAPLNPDSAASQIGWEESATPFTVWTAVPTTGATHDYRVRYTPQIALRYDYYYLRARAHDGFMYGAWTTSIRVLVAYSGSEKLIGTIDGTVWYLEECNIVENTGGEPSPLEMTIPTLLVDAAANPPERGDSVSVACNIEGTARTWNATLEEVVYDGPYVRLSCLQDDAYLSRKLATGDVVSADVGHNLGHFVTSYGTPLTGTGIDATTGLTAALTGGYKNLREHFADWSDALLYYLYVDATGDITWCAEADLGVPEFVLREG